MSGSVDRTMIVGHVYECVEPFASGSYCTWARHAPEVMITSFIAQIDLDRVGVNGPLAMSTICPKFHSTLLFSLCSSLFSQPSVPRGTYVANFVKSFFLEDVRRRQSS